MHPGQDQSKGKQRSFGFTDIWLNLKGENMRKVEGDGRRYEGNRQKEMRMLVLLLPMLIVCGIIIVLVCYSYSMLKL